VNFAIECEFLADEKNPGVTQTPGCGKEDKRQVQSRSSSTNRRWSLFYDPGTRAKKDLESFCQPDIASAKNGANRVGWRSTRVCNQIIYQKSRNYYEWIFTNSFSTFARTRQRNLPNKRQQKHFESCSPCMQSGCSCSSSSSSISYQIPNPDPFQPPGCVDFPAFWRHAPFVFISKLKILEHERA